jgi:phosphoribosyl 1,2-cyclic phosphodiesterase
MDIRCWGARGSIPVSGPECLKYGGATTCIELRAKDGQIIIVDAGSGIRKLGNALLKEKQREFKLIFTHAHWDHLLGFPFFKPIYLADMHIEVFGCPFAQSSIRQMLSGAMHPPYFPVNLADLRAEITYYEACNQELYLGSVTVIPIFLSHPNGGTGYKFVEDGKAFVFLTDNELAFTHPGGLTFQDYLAFTSGADLLMHDAEFTPEEYRVTRTWGHSTYSDALRLAMEAKVARFGLFHHNQDRTDAGVDAIVEKCQGILTNSNADLECCAVREGMEITL